LPPIDVGESALLPLVAGVLKEKETHPWTHRGRKPNVDCPNAEMSPIEVAIVWVKKKNGVKW
jgi:hypothetical protein